MREYYNPTQKPKFLLLDILYTENSQSKITSVLHSIGFSLCTVQSISPVFITVFPSPLQSKHECLLSIIVN